MLCTCLPSRVLLLPPFPSSPVFLAWASLLLLLFPQYVHPLPPPTLILPRPWLVSPEVSFPGSSGVLKGSLWVTLCSSLLTNWIWGWGTSCMSHSRVGGRRHVGKALVASESSRTHDVGRCSIVCSHSNLEANLQNLEPILQQTCPSPSLRNCTHDSENKGHIP